MAASMPSNTMEDIAISLTEEDQVPVKLRCSICNLIAFNARKLPCCDQNICANCHSSLPQTCPICQHDHPDAVVANPSKTVRLTVEQFLKNIKKRREKARATLSSDAPAPVLASPVEVQVVVELVGTPLVDIPPTVALEANSSTLETESFWEGQEETPAPVKTPPPGTYDPAEGTVEVTAERVAEEGREVQELEATADPGANFEESNDDNESTQDDDDAESESSDIQIVTGDEEARAADLDVQQGGEWDGQGYDGQMNGQAYGYQGGQGDFSQMGFNNPEMMNMMMQQMGNMQNGGFANMMNMPGMGMNGMNPMDMSAMFNSFAAMQGMNGMNPNMMSMNGMNGMMGMDYNNGNFNGWNGQQMGGDFGASSGYYSGGGYNQSHQGNFPNMSHHQQFSKNNFHNQNRVSGSQRGFGRGYHNQGFHGRSQSQTMPGGDGPPAGAPTGPKAQKRDNDGAFHHQLAVHTRVASTTGSAEGRRASVSRPGSKDGNKREGQTDTGTNLDSNAQVGGEVHNTGDEQGREETTKVDDSATGPSSSLKGDARDDANVHATSNGQKEMSNETPNSWNRTNGLSNESYDQRQSAGDTRGRGGYESRASFRGRGGSSWQHNGLRGSETTLTPSDPAGQGVQGAPTGPKALRDGSNINGRGRGGLNGAARSHSHSISSNKPEDIIDTRARSRSPSITREQSRRHSRRQRSRTPVSEDEEERRDRKRRRSSRKNEEDYNEHDHGRRRTRDEGATRSRADSVEDEYQRSRRENDRLRSTKTRRDPSKERHRHRRRSRSPDSKANGHGDSSETLHADERDIREKEKRREKDRYRDRSRDKDRHRNRSRDKKRSSRRDRSVSRESDHHRSSRSSKREKEKEAEPARDTSRRESRDHNAARPKASQPTTPSIVTQLQAKMKRQDGFQFLGRSRVAKKDSKADVEPESPTLLTPEALKMQPPPPSGPRAERSERAPASSKFKLGLDTLNTKAATGTQRSSAASSRRPSQPATPVAEAPPKKIAPVDPYEEERRKAQEARINKELSRRKLTEGVPLTRKRSWPDTGVGEELPSGPREKKGKKGRRTSYQYDDEDGDERYR